MHESTCAYKTSCNRPDCRALSKAGDFSHTEACEHRLVYCEKG
jgi:hypothetical protein